MGGSWSTLHIPSSAPRRRNQTNRLRRRQAGQGITKYPGISSQDGILNMLLAKGQMHRLLIAVREHLGISISSYNGDSAQAALSWCLAFGDARTLLPRAWKKRQSDSAWINLRGFYVNILALAIRRPPVSTHRRHWATVVQGWHQASSP